MDKTLKERVDALVDEYRCQCLWFLRTDYYPESLEQAVKVLGYIERHGDTEAFRKAAEAKQWLLHHSKEPSVV